jgi:hypothetical protein
MRVTPRRHLCRSATHALPTGCTAHCFHLQGALKSLQEGTGKSSEQLLKSVLGMSFASLDPVAQGMFLDTVSLLAGEPCSQALAVWEAWHGPQSETAFSVLRSRNLVSVADEDRSMLWQETRPVEVLRVHDVVLSLGRSLLRDTAASSHYGTRAWVEQGHLIGLPHVRFYGGKWVVHTVCCHVPA